MDPARKQEAKKKQCYKKTHCGGCLTLRHNMFRVSLCICKGSGTHEPLSVRVLFQAKWTNRPHDVTWISDGFGIEGLNLKAPKVGGHGAFVSKYERSNLSSRTRAESRKPLLVEGSGNQHDNRKIKMQQFQSTKGSPGRGRNWNLRTLAGQT